MNAAKNTSRIATVDIMKGIALLGILIINVQAYTLFGFLYPGQVYQLQLDNPETYGPIQIFITLLCKGQFYTMYSFLFGLGFYYMFQKYEAAGFNSAVIVKQRLLILFIIGLIHGLIFWFGDMLHKYALVGLSLLYFNKKPVRVIIRWIAGLILFVILFQLVKATWFTQTQQASIAANLQMDQLKLQAANTWQHGSVAEVAKLQKTGMFILWMKDIESGFSNLIQYQVMLLVGLIAGKTNLFNRIVENKMESKLICMVLIVMPLAVFFKGLYSLNEMQVILLPGFLHSYDTAIFSLAGFIGILLLSMVYLPVLFIAFKKRHNRLFTWIANAGKMSLTNYLLQTPVCMIAFYGYAGGLSGKLNLFNSSVFALVIYLLQVVYSNVWLKYHHYGPVENILRNITAVVKIPATPSIAIKVKSK